MDQPGVNPTNNPKMDLLRGGGTNIQSNIPEPAGGVPPGFTSGAAPADTKPLPAATYLDQAKAQPAPVFGAAASAPTPPPAQSAPVTAMSAQPDAAPAPVPVEPEPKPAPPPPVAAPPASPRRGRLLVLLAAIILAAIGAGVWYYFNQAKPVPVVPIEIQPVDPTGLKQSEADTSRGLDAGAATKQKKLTLSFTIPTTANTGSLTPQLELRKSGTDFTGEPTTVGEEVQATGSDITVNIPVENLEDGFYHWQVRTVKGEQASEWVVFGDDPKAVAFMVDTVAPAAPSLQSLGGSSVSDTSGTITVASRKPAFVGKADPSSKVKVSIQNGPELTATADASGSWSVAPTSDLADGQYKVSIVASDAADNPSAPLAFTMEVKAAAASSSAPAATETPAATAPAATTPAATDTADTSLAPTGDETSLISAFSLMVFAISLAVLIRRKPHYGSR